MTYPARINLVRSDSIATSEGLLTVGNAWTQPDEVELLNPDGESAADVTGSGYTDADITYQYVSGGLGTAQRRQRHRISLAVDYISDALRSKLERWYRDRALVLYCPGYGRHTDIAMRPLVGAGSTFRDGTTTLTDLTGRYNVAHTGHSGTVWDAASKVLRGTFAGSNPRRVFRTPAGSGQAFERAKYNRMIPPMPYSADEGNEPYAALPPAGGSGWTKGGTHSADLTFAWNENGFGHSTYRHSLTVTADNTASRTRHVVAQTLWDSGSGNYQGYTFTGSSTATVSIWVRGRVGVGAKLIFEHGTESVEVELDDLDLTDWAKVSLALDPQDDDWEEAIPKLYFDLSTGASGNTNPRLEIGPCIVNHHASNTVSRDPELSFSETATAEDYASVSSYRYPAAGSAMTSFWVPEGADLDLVVRLFSNGISGRVGQIALTGSTLSFTRAIGADMTATVSVSEGAINTACAVWPADGGVIRLYFNGALVDSEGYSNGISTNSGTLYFGYQTWPVVPLTWRIDRRTWTAQDVAEYDTTLRDPYCNQLAVHARGRKYRLASIPSAKREQQGGPVWFGDLVLEEYEYDHNLADLVSEDV